MSRHSRIAGIWGGRPQPPTPGPRGLEGESSFLPNREGIGVEGGELGVLRRQRVRRTDGRREERRWGVQML